ncbi:N-formylglutamate amidohydrolase [uncultured Marivirga sp.]|uniref:N-formylglutamate amidohydrolase n=1 Tax=uncultured Marivirga sp. TaxID=1123707 RepID=UPI0030ED335F|tara:strand:- start:32283 stop:32999 length:717 start_codon:yes stop_codon:yes gene_type:complete
MTKFIFSCEHGGYEIPEEFQSYFRGKENVLLSHRGWDRGALEIGKYISRRADSKLIASSISRLLIESNRTLQHEDLFSEFSKIMPQEIQQQLIEEYYLPYRAKLERKIEQHLQHNHKVIHLSFHSFTPVLNGETRKTEIGILFDPANLLEQEFALAWKESIEDKIDSWRIKFNYPYKGTDDGLTTYFRAKYPKNYAGLELEVNTKLMDCYPMHQISNWVFPPLFNRKGANLADGKQGR